MANLNSIVRALIKLMYGADLPPGTHAQALQHYRAACALDPARLVHRRARSPPAILQKLHGNLIQSI